ncbi:hypothetical protein [Allosphingosinicella indica]|uniref:Uncharacterized protein n=1 Tax=Allosphingosinicella indica TaxID=941907 RepID=A0A1X7G605_9SPHN|nr:hypothetical protein [Allosphingosinicella indica]SMF64647.1 hypothetical protein SAMN06295910_1222 [Allosphingosinicella indica]
MPLPRPSPPRVLWADLRAFLRNRSRHHWIAGLLAVVLPALIIAGFIIDARINIMPGEQLIYVESWQADRSDDEIKAAQEVRQKEREEALAERQRAFQRLEKKLGMDD